MARRARMALRLLLSRHGLVAPLGVAIPGRGAAPVALRRLPSVVLAEGPVALGTAPRAAVRGGGVDPPPADADARHSLGIREELTLNHRIPPILLLGLLSSLALLPSSLARADGGAVRLRQRAGGYQIA